ncbi:uncharacterized protein LOC135841105 isoform X3 [Planococcus citri]
MDSLKHLVPLGHNSARHTTLGLLIKAKNFIKMETRSSRGRGGMSGGAPRGRGAHHSCSRRVDDSSDGTDPLALQEALLKALDAINLNLQKMSNSSSGGTAMAFKTKYYRNRNRKPYGRNYTKSKERCYICGANGHRADFCKVDASSGIKFGYKCRQLTTHIAQNCDGKQQKGKTWKMKNPPPKQPQEMCVMQEASMQHEMRNTNATAYMAGHSRDGEINGLEDGILQINLEEEYDEDLNAIVISECQAVNSNFNKV